MTRAAALVAQGPPDPDQDERPGPVTVGVDPAVARRLEDQYATLVADQLTQAADTTAAGLHQLASPDDAAVLRGLWADRLTQTLQPTLTLAWLYGAATVREQLREQLPVQAAAAGWSDPPVVPPELARDWVQADPGRLGGIADDLLDQARRELLDGLDAGDSVHQLRGRLALLTGQLRSRAAQLARDQVYAALAAGTQAQAEATNLPGSKQWVSMRDERVRPTHVEADGQVVPIPDPFLVGGWPAQRPHDPALPAEEAAGCRCVVRYALDATDLHYLTVGPVGRGTAAVDHRIRAEVDGGALEEGWNVEQLTTIYEQYEALRELAAQIGEALQEPFVQEETLPPEEALPAAAGPAWFHPGHADQQVHGQRKAGGGHPDLTGALVMDVGLDPATAKRVQATTDHLADRYGPEITRVTSDFPRDAPAGAIAAMDNRGTLAINPINLDEGRLAGAVRQGKLAHGEERVEGVIIHEYGHRLLHSPEATYSRRVQDSRQAAWNAAREAGYHDTVEQVDKDLSRYATFDPEEEESEVFSNYHRGGAKRTPWVKAWGDTFDRSYGADTTAKLTAAAPPPPEGEGEGERWWTPGFVIPTDQPTTGSAAEPEWFHPGHANQKVHGHRRHTPITASEARGNSRPVSAAEFQHLAQEGQDRLETLRAHRSPPAGLDRNWDAVRGTAYTESQKSWGGATFDAHTGKTVQPTSGYVLSIKSHSDSVSVPEGASRVDFDQAMDTARGRFHDELSMEKGHLGVFHDNDQHRIDIDPVIVVGSLHEVETIGAATHAIGGAYGFADGNGYWPPHVAEGVAAAANGETHWRGLGEWYANVRKTQHTSGVQGSTTIVEGCGWALQAAAGDASDGAMVALVPTAGQQQELALDDDDAEAAEQLHLTLAEQLHLTLAYLGDAADWSQRQRAALIERLRTQVAERVPPDAAHAFGAAHWNTDTSEPSWVLQLGGTGLEVVHGHVWELLGGDRDPALPEQHAPWVPHICLAYSPDPALGPKVEERVGREVAFDRLRVAFGDQVTDLPLSGTAGEAEAAAGGPEWFHLPGKHNQASHGRKRGAGAAGLGRPGMGDIPVDDAWAARFRNGSAAPYLLRNPDGSMRFTPERQALHDRIVTGALAGKHPPDGQPVFHVLGGGPASGKTSLLDTERGLAMRDPNVAQIGLDDLRAQLPGYADALKPGGSGPSAFHNEAAYLTARTSAAAAERRLSMTLDTTGNSDVRDKIARAKQAGYRVEGHYVTVPIPVAIERADARGAQIGRYVPHEGLIAIHDAVSETLPPATRDFDHLELYDNRGARGTPPTPVMHWDGHTQTIDSPRLWQEFLDKAKAAPPGVRLPVGVGVTRRVTGGAGR